MEMLQLTLLLNQVMQKNKVTTSQSKSKQKITISTPTNKKSLTKTKQKTTPCSPRANRIHTLEAKTSPHIPKKTKNNNPHDDESPLRHLTDNLNHHAKGYQTPKFKCQSENPAVPPRTTVPHNFFSFGEKELQKPTHTRLREKEKQNHALGRQINRIRKDQRFR